MAKNKTMLNVHAQRYISAVFQQKLIQEGFTCPDDKLLCWYRIRNSEILDTVIFYTRWERFPIMMEILYECAPLYFAPIRINNVAFKETHANRSDCYRSCMVLEGTGVDEANIGIFSTDIMVYAPQHGARGLFTLTDVVFPYFDGAQTASDCYRQHKQARLECVDEETGAVYYGDMSKEFIEEVLWDKDTEMYGYSKTRIEAAINMCEEILAENPGRRSYVAMLKDWKQLRSAFLEGGWATYEIKLAKCAGKNLSHITRMLG